MKSAVLLDPEVSAALRACAEKASLEADRLPSLWADLTVPARLEVHLPH